MFLSVKMRRGGLNHRSPVCCGRFRCLLLPFLLHLQARHPLGGVCEPPLCVPGQDLPVEAPGRVGLCDVLLKYHVLQDILGQVLTAVQEAAKPVIQRQRLQNTNITLEYSHTLVAKSIEFEYSEFFFMLFFLFTVCKH